jgi:two-component system chemotaxis sensor kinase CheA
MDELLAQFLVEGRELVADAQRHLEALGGAAADPAAIDGAFRAVHTLKGSVALFDMAPAGRLLHAAEDVLDRARRGRATLDERTRAALVTGIDAVDRWIDALAADGQLPADAAAEAARCVAALGAGPAAESAGPGAAAVPPWAEALLESAAALVEPIEAPLVAFRYAPDAGCFFRGDDPLKQAAAAPDLLALRVAPREPWPDLADLAPFDCNLVIEGLSLAPADAVRAAFRLAGDQIVLAELPARRPGQAARAGGPRTLRIDEARIDALADDVGELVLAAHALAHLGGEVARLDAALGARLRQVQAGLEGALGTLHRHVTAARMVPLAPVLRRLPRLAREIAAELGRDVAFVVEGEGMAVDKAIADMLFEPLLHLLRNAIDHGIEPPDRRRASGKPAQGTVRLRVEAAGGQVVAALSDDGAGIDAGRVAAVAVERGVIAAEAATLLSDEAALRLVFAPGFSTAGRVTQISGRGVGMDAVKVAVEALGGTVSIASTPGQGTTTTLRLPLSAITTRLLVVGAGGERYGVPFHAIVETAAISAEAIRPVGQGEALVLRGRTVPLLHLAALLGQAPAPRGDTRLLVVEAAGERVAIAVDAFGEQIDAMVRSPGRLLAAVPAVAGTTVLGDGEVLLVLDPARLVA